MLLCDIYFNRSSHFRYMTPLISCYTGTKTRIPTLTHRCLYTNHAAIPINKRDKCPFNHDLFRSLEFSRILDVISEIWVYLILKVIKRKRHFHSRCIYTKNDTTYYTVPIHNPTAAIGEFIVDISWFKQ